MLPEVGCKNLVSKLKKVVLPAPFGPIRAWISPCLTRTETPSTATNPLKSLTRLCVSRIISSANAITPCPLECMVWERRYCVRPLQLEAYRYRLDGFKAQCRDMAWMRESVAHR